ncbi:MAG: nitric-oxide reductase [Proteobacteria bacterium]|nr:MAG: nitric-oxide reductase [Pseudomonadota bacterium]
MSAQANIWTRFVMKRSNWWLPLLLVMLVGAGSLAFVGKETYTEAPPIPDFVGPDGAPIIRSADITRGQTVFLQKALMEYGSMFGDGAGRGPDFTAEALQLTARHMRDYYLKQSGVDPADELQQALATSRAQVEIKKNTYDAQTNAVRLTAGQVYALGRLEEHYREFFTTAFQPSGYIVDDSEIRSLAAFFFWGGWVCGAERPGFDYSYTHNWPFDPLAGNRPAGPLVLWSVIGSMGLMVALGAVLFLYGRYNSIAGWGAAERAPTVATTRRVTAHAPSQIQKATYKFFATAAALFVLQIIAGILTVHDFLGLTTLFGVDLSTALPITITRSWHLQLALMWISACWIGASIFVLSTAAEETPRGQLTLVNVIYGLTVTMVAGSLVGVFMGPHGLLGAQWNFFGNQGWEFVEQGKFWQGMLFVIFALWAVAVARFVLPAWRDNPPWTLPKWLLYAVVAIVVLFISGFVATPETNFVIADFWRWAVIHMWVEAFFEVFATIVLAYFMYLMGFVSHNAASRIVYLAALLFLGSGLLGIAHNFYWNAKPVATVAIGSVFSTLQVVPLILLTLEAWQFRKTPERLMNGRGLDQGEIFGQQEAFLFLLGVNFWNFLGAGVFGFIINLPIVNYYEHGTYLTVNHGHAALMGVYGNLALAAIVFCARYLVRSQAWNAKLLHTAFWSINIGLALMVVMDLFPVGIDQFMAVLDHGFWYARSADYINSATFQSLTWARILGGAIFTLGGVLPLAWFAISRLAALKPVSAMKADLEPAALPAE